MATANWASWLDSSGRSGTTSKIMSLPGISLNPSGMASLQALRMTAGHPGVQGASRLVVSLSWE
jgi:hypothetical protein